MQTKYFAFTVLGGAIILSFGFAGGVASSYLSSAVQLSTGMFLRIWAEAILGMVIGSVAIVGGGLMATEGKTAKESGGVLGIISSVAGAMDSLVLLTTFVGAQTEVIVISPQLEVSYSVLYLGSILALFVGFPIVMFGSVAGLLYREGGGSSRGTN